MWNLKRTCVAGTEKNHGQEEMLWDFANFKAKGKKVVKCLETKIHDLWGKMNKYQINVVEIKEGNNHQSWHQSKSEKRKVIKICLKFWYLCRKINEYLLYYSRIKVLIRLKRARIYCSFFVHHVHLMPYTLALLCIDNFQI